MAAYYGVLMAQNTREMMFAGDGVPLLGRIDYPKSSPPPASGYPLVFLLHHAGGNTHEDYQHYADIALQHGYAVFRWDKRGTGRSGAGGRGSATQDAVNAYETALEQPGIDRHRAFILAQGGGTRLLGSAFGLFVRLQVPCGAVLVANRLDEKEIQAINTRVHIVQGGEDWGDWKQYAEAASQAHSQRYAHGASFYIAEGANCNMIDHRSNRFHSDALQSIADWLGQQCQAST